MKSIPDDALVAASKTLLLTLRRAESKRKGANGDIFTPTWEELTEENRRLVATAMQRSIAVADSLREAASSPHPTPA